MDGTTSTLSFCTCVDDARDRGGGGTEESKVDPSGVLVGPGIGVASLTIGRAGWVVGGGVGERDEFEIGAVVEDLGTDHRRPGGGR